MAAAKVSTLARAARIHEFAELTTPGTQRVPRRHQKHLTHADRMAVGLGQGAAGEKIRRRTTISSRGADRRI
jgi:hypothetical protein